MNNVDQYSMAILNEGELWFGQDHPNRHYCFIKHSKTLECQHFQCQKEWFVIRGAQVIKGKSQWTALQDWEKYAKVS